MQPQPWDDAAPCREGPWEEFVLRGGKGSGQAGLGLWGGAEVPQPWGAAQGLQPEGSLGSLCSGTTLGNAGLGHGHSVSDGWRAACGWGFGEEITAPQRLEAPHLGLCWIRKSQCPKGWRLFTWACAGSGNQSGPKKTGDVFLWLLTVARGAGSGNQSGAPSSATDSVNGPEQSILYLLGSVLLL